MWMCKLERQKRITWISQLLKKKQMKNKNQTAKEKRGFTTEVENNLFISKSDNELISLLKSNNPKERTSSATILGQRKSEIILLDILKTSKKPELKWEAVRSLGLICKEVPEELLIAKNDKNDNVKKMVFLAINKIHL